MRRLPECPAWASAFAAGVAMDAFITDLALDRPYWAIANALFFVVNGLFVMGKIAR